MQQFIVKMDQACELCSWHPWNLDSVQHTQAKNSTCFPELVSKETNEEAKDSKNGEEYFGREFGYKETNEQVRWFFYF